MVMDAHPLSLGEYIRRLRREANRSLGSLSDETGISYTHLSRIESDSTLPNADTVTKIAVALSGDLKRMLELARCLPREILDRIGAHDLTSLPPSLSRSAFQGDESIKTGVGAGAIFNYALNNGLNQEEAREMENMMRTLCSLGPDTRRHVVQFIRGLFNEGDDATG
jgi:transcriptional regulator with XRE-family HTH domain